VNAATRIEGLLAWEALDSRGRPTVACAVRLAGGARGHAVVPSGASTGTHEALELRDGDERRYGGRGVRRAVAHVNGDLAAVAVGLDAADQPALDAALRAADGTPNLSRLGANATLAVSVAAALAAADAERAPLHARLDPAGEPLLPLPMVNVLSGGAHASGALDMQDFLVVPTGATSFAGAIEIAWSVRSHAERLARERGLPVGLVADEGGLGLALPSHRAALELLVAAIERAGLVPGEQAAIAIDVAATQLAAGDGYRLAIEDRTLAARELVAELVRWCAEYPIVSLEDPVGDTDREGWELASAELTGRVQLVGDDLFATDADRLGEGIREGIANAVLVKPNQTGTLSGAAEVVCRAREAAYATVVSARSGDTEDAWLADLAVGWRAGQIKVGSLARSERTAKWNRLQRIQAEAGERARFAGAEALAR
jgi:enolase